MFDSRAGEIEHCRQRPTIATTFLCCPGAKPRCYSASVTNKDMIFFISCFVTVGLTIWKYLTRGYVVLNTIFMSC